MLPIFPAAVALGALVSLVLKAVLMNLPSIGAAYGVLVAVFQWGHAGHLIGVSAAPIEAWAPMMLFAIVFGLSMDYEVFLLSAIREHYDEPGDNARSVATGLASTARVIAAAATMMVVVFGSFLVSGARSLKEIGVGLAIAIAIDATIVRVVLVPATMELLGRANWWLPGWLARLLPQFNVERPVALAPATPETYTGGRSVGTAASNAAVVVSPMPTTSDSRATAQLS